MLRRVTFVFVVGLAALATACGSDSSGGPAVCGNGDQEPGEECDGIDLAWESCASLGLEGGTLSCASTCTFDVSECTGTSNCGDDERQYPEECDGADLAGAACSDYGFTGGELTCTPNCTLDLAGCTGDPPCGDGLLAPGEDCDTNNLSGQTCASLGLGTGDLACASDCTFDTSDCSAGPTCGDDVAEGTEACDGSDLAGETCVSQGFDGGELTCTANCTLDDSGCFYNALCGNGSIDTGEDCDGADLGGETCVSQGYSGGTLACDTACAFDTSGCLGEVCGNGVQEGSEACDGTDFGSTTCVTLGYDGGFLACTNNCTIDDSGCSTCSSTDTDPPVASNHLPAPDTQGYGPTDPIGLDLFDACGIDLSTLDMTLTIETGGPSLIQTVTPLVTGAGTNVSLIYTPTNPLPEGAIVTVTVTVDDINGNTLVETWRYSVWATMTLFSGGPGGMPMMNELDETQPNTVIAGFQESYLAGGGSPSEHRVLIRFSPPLPPGSVLVDATLSLARCPGMTAVATANIDCYGLRVDTQATSSTWMESQQGPPGPNVLWSVPGADGVPADRSGTLGATVHLQAAVGDYIWQSGPAVDLLTEWYAGDGSPAWGIVCTNAASTAINVCSPHSNGPPKIDLTYGPALP